MFTTGYWLVGLTIASAACGPKAAATLRLPVGHTRVVLDTPFEVETTWSKTCDDSSIFDSNSRARKRRHPCEEQSYRVAIQCSSACDVSASDAFTGWGTVTVIPLVQGPLGLTVVMTRVDDGTTVRHELGDVEVVMPRELALECGDGRVGWDCGLHPLPADEPVVHPAVLITRSETAVPRTMTINGRLPASLMSRPGILNLSDLYPEARRADGSLTPGHYPVTLAFHHLHRTWDVVVE
jgi:hypothetical protein